MKWLMLAVLVLGACARPYPPPGGEEDRLAPLVDTIIPGPGTIVTDFDDKVVFEYNERIAERGVRDLVVVSPESGDPIIDKGRDRLSVSLPGGWRPGTIYRVVVLPGVSDMFGNVTTEQVELVFSTGPPIPNTTLAGIVTDRLTGGAAGGARIEAVHLPDSARYASATDAEGFFVFRNIPSGDYLLRGYLDQSRNRVLDLSDPRDSVRIALGADTTTVTLSLLATDTTPARVTRAEAPDSMQVRVSLDDYVDPLVHPSTAIRAQLWRLGPAGTEQRDSVAVPVRSVVYAAEYEARVAAALDTAQTEARPDTVRILPSQSLVVIPGAPLQPRTRYRVLVSGVTNIFGLADGGGSVEFTTPEFKYAPPPEEPAEEVPDSASAGRRNRR